MNVNDSHHLKLVKVYQTSENFMNYPEGVSIVTCTYNGANRLVETIQHIVNQQVDPSIEWELLVIDNASDDGSGKIARDSWKLQVPLRVIIEKRKGVSYARHRGIREAKYEFISFVDDDNWINPNWVQNVFTILRNRPEVGICGSLNTGVYESIPPDWFESIKGAFAIGKQGEETGYITKREYFWGAGMSFRKSSYEKLKDSGFRFILTGRKGKKLTAGEDTELCYALRMAGWEMWYSENLTLQHYIPSSRFNWNYVVRLYYGFGNSHAIFDIYKLVMNNKPYRPYKFYRKIFREYWFYYRMKRKGAFKEITGNKDFLKYKFHKARLRHAVYNFNKNRTLYDRLMKLHQTLNSSG